MQYLKVERREERLFSENTIIGAMRKSIFNCEAQGCTEFIGRIDRDRLYIIGSIGKGSFGAEPCTMVSKLVALPGLVFHMNGGESREKALTFSSKGRTSSRRNLPLKVRKLTMGKISPCIVTSGLGSPACHAD